MTGKNAFDLHLALSNTAKVFLGVREVTANRGPMVESFQKAVDGKASGEPWCAGFVAFCVKEVEKQFRAKASLSLSESCVLLWKKNKENQTQICKPGHIVVWQFGETQKGHCGIVAELDPTDPGYFFTVEGNTSDGKGINREGDGVFRKRRHRVSSPGFHLLGFLDPWKQKPMV